MALVEEVPEDIRVAPPRQRWRVPVAAFLGLALSIFAFYFAPYPIRHARLPAGFDAPWYVWRARFVGSQGIGPVGTSSRPGHAVLSALLGSVTGRSQLELVVVFSQLLPALLALAVAALAMSVTGRGRTMWVVTALVTGAVLGATRLVGENLANLLNVALEVGAVVVLAHATKRRTALWGAVALLVAAGLAHWVFLAVFGVALTAAVGVSLLTARRVDEARGLEIREEARFLAVGGLWTAAVVGFLIVAVLRTRFRTFEIFQNPQEYAPKLITDVARLWPWALAAAVGIGALMALRREPLDPERAGRRSFTGRIMVGWALATAAGVLFGLATLEVNRFSLPPHRFLALLVAVPGMVVAGAGVWWLGRWALLRAGRRLGTNEARFAGVATVGLLLVALSVPSVIRWYRYPILMRARAIQQAETASEYVAGLSKGHPFVFAIDPHGPAVVYDAPLREREIRMGLPPDRQEDLHVFVGNPSDLLAGRRTSFDPLIDRITAAYWGDVSKILSARPPVLVLQAMGRKEFAEAMTLGARELAPGVALLQGPAPPAPLARVALPNGVPPVPLALLWALVLLALLTAAGLGWTWSLVGPSAPREVFLSLAPLVGTAALLLGGFLVTVAGGRLAGGGGVATYVAVAAGGLGSAFVRVRRRATSAGRLQRGFLR